MGVITSCLDPMRQPDVIPDPRVLTVVGISGDVILDTTEVSSILELKEQVSTQMHTKNIKLLSAEGRVIAKLEDAEPDSTVTAIALNLSPLLQMVGLEDDKGNLVSETVPRDELETIALQIARELSSIGCWFGSPGHMDGYPTVEWEWTDKMPAPPYFSSESRFDEGSRGLTIKRSTPVVHAGAEVMFSVQKASPVPKVLQDFTAETPLTVADLINLRRIHQAACDEKRHMLLKEIPGADYVEGTMQLKQYGPDCLHIELGYRVYDRDEEWR
ncbi:DNAH7 [Symbiodinium natans]|uniref:DNAH7 protein n=1 Tax=Symbiodinium natans TaxID=878477 RepID=A0A812KNJ2_9DINO|nr:DNAH7 [Symbiodinium natans]